MVAGRGRESNPDEINEVNEIEMTIALRIDCNIVTWLTRVINWPLCGIKTYLMLSDLVQVNGY